MYVTPPFTTNCSTTGLQQFPTYLSDTIRPRYDFIFISVALSLYLFVALAIVCDEYFVPAVERLCYKLHMRYDIAGSTFMAAATSSPEFFVHAVATFITGGDIGVGTIVGSSVFNTLAVVACCGTFSGLTASLDWWPITRDVVWYIFAVTVLASIIMDGIVNWYEGLLLVCLYSLNLTSLIFDRDIQNALRNPDNECFPCFVPAEESIDLSGIMDIDPQELDEEEPFNLKSYPFEENVSVQLFWICSWPLQAVFYLTVPNVRREFGRRFYIISLMSCVIWISMLSYCISWTITVFGVYLPYVGAQCNVESFGINRTMPFAIGYNLRIPDSVMGITFLAAGTSIPEAVASLAVTRKGYGSMAVCNSLSSNTFDIFVCLGFPWFMKGAFLPTSPNIHKVFLNSYGLGYISFTLIATATLMYLSFVLSRFKLGRSVGISCMIMYFAYVAFACMVETNMFAVVNLPSCDFTINP